MRLCPAALGDRPPGPLGAGQFQALASRHSTTVCRKAHDVILGDAKGWALIQDSSGEARMAGHVAMGRRPSRRMHMCSCSHHCGMMSSVLCRRSFLEIGLAAAAVLTLCTFAGFYIIRSNILLPLAMLGRAAQSITGTARRTMPQARTSSRFATGANSPNWNSRPSRISGTGDESKPLPGILQSCHRASCATIESRTEVAEDPLPLIRADLEMAREFQNSLLPSRYPEIPWRRSTTRGPAASPVRPFLRSHRAG